MGYFLMVLSGFLLTIPYNNPHYFLVSWIGLIPALVGLRLHSSAKNNFICGLVLGLTLLVRTGYWLYYPLHDFSGLPVIFVVVLLFIFFLLMGIFYGIWAFIFTRFQRKDKFSPFLLAITWVGLEYIRYYLVSSFPFGFIGYTQSGFKLLLQSAELGGVFLISFIVILINGYIYKLLVKRSWKVIIPLIIFIALFSFYGHSRLDYYSQSKKNDNIEIGLIQTNIPQNEKWLKANIKKNLNLLLAGTKKYNKEKLIISPESALTFDLVRNEYYRNIFFDKFKQLHTFFQVGSLAVEGDSDRQYNSSFLISPEGKVVNRYNKKNLVPFGEIIPFEKLVNKITGLNLLSLNSGNKSKIFKTSFANWENVICSEILYPSLIGKNIQAASFLINQTNEAWFRVSNLHQQMWNAAIFRAVEVRRPVVRAGNLTFNGLILPSGITEKKTNYNSKEVDFVSVSVPLNYANSDNTFYQKHGDYIGYISAIIIALLLILNFIRYVGRRNR